MLKNAPSRQFTPLHLAAISGNTQKAKEHVQKYPGTLNQPDRLGMTPLHHACLYENSGVVELLVDEKADVLILDNSGKLPISHVPKSSKNIKKFLIEHGSFPKRATDIHLYASRGQLDKIKALLESQPEKIFALDADDNTPLFYAVNFNQYETFLYLLENGASPHFVNKHSMTLCDIAAQLQGENSEKKLPIYELVQSVCRLPEASRLAFQQQFIHLIQSELQKATAENKKLLIYLGESHFTQMIIDLEVALLQVAKKLGINTLLDESLPNDEITYPSTDYAKSMLDMTIVPIDSSEKDSLEARNKAMIENIFNQSQSAVAIVGAKHLRGLLEIAHPNISSSDFYEKFRVVPFNLHSMLNDELVPSKFAKNRENVIQIENKDTFSDHQTVIEKWNPPSPKDKKRKRRMP